MKNENDPGTNARATLAAALAFLGGDQGAVREEPPRPTLRGNRDEIRRQMDRLRAGGVLPVFDIRRLGERLDEGGEHEVFAGIISEEIRFQRVFKVTRPTYAGVTMRAVLRSDGAPRIAMDDATPAEYFFRLQLHNEIFGDDIWLEGLTPDFALVISQPLVVGGLPSSDEVTETLLAGGFYPTPDRCWYHPALHVALADTKNANFIRASDGLIWPVDVIVFVPTRTMLATWKIDATG